MKRCPLLIFLVLILAVSRSAFAANPCNGILAQVLKQAPGPISVTFTGRAGKTTFIRDVEIIATKSSNQITSTLVVTGILSQGMAMEFDYSWQGPANTATDLFEDYSPDTSAGVAGNVTASVQDTAGSTITLRIEGCRK